MVAELTGKHIVIGITGGIAAYKTMFLIRQFKSSGCDVRVVATRSALEFVTPLTIETLSQNKLYVDLFEPTAQRDVQHISMADWADCVIIAPATANIIGKYAHGIADDALSTLLLATRKPIFIAPAMNNQMYAEPTVQHNIELLRQKGVHIIEPQCGFLACGTTGTGRMEEPENIFTIVQNHFKSQQLFSGKRVMITAGPTYEPIDPVRFIGNHSSGLMGYALAEAAAEMGADVTLVSGPTSLTINHPMVKRIDVMTAEQMYEQCMAIASEQDVMILAAAVADYTPKEVASEKIKKKTDNLDIQLVKTKDILASIGKQKQDHQFLVGFALETQNEKVNALQKLHNKNADLIVLNSLRTKGAGFRTPTNQVVMITRDEQTFESELKSKREIAYDILQVVNQLTNPQDVQE
ncbi:MAG: bifunctional phosphopantothenoylcysteine decarboxylase/phosphopantothenate--cysteine ligase CoaBC [Bacteroidales bacterium]|nr:bifunctional phosphopantothenoylcysteine decarboxylase/phosphopantothenate--cysteine ligase CoaBC [Bacteroidales bacterium]